MDEKIKNILDRLSKSKSSNEISSSSLDSFAAAASSAKYFLSNVLMNG